MKTLNFSIETDDALLIVELSKLVANWSLKSLPENQLPPPAMTATATTPIKTPAPKNDTLFDGTDPEKAKLFMDFVKVCNKTDVWRRDGSRLKEILKTNPIPLSFSSVEKFFKENDFLKEESVSGAPF